MIRFLKRIKIAFGYWKMKVDKDAAVSLKTAWEIANLVVED